MIRLLEGVSFFVRITFGLFWLGEALFQVSIPLYRFSSSLSLEAKISGNVRGKVGMSFDFPAGWIKTQVNCFFSCFLTNEPSDFYVCFLDQKLTVNIRNEMS